MYQGNAKALPDLIVSGTIKIIWFIFNSCKVRSVDFHQILKLRAPLSRILEFKISPSFPPPLPWDMHFMGDDGVLYEMIRDTFGAKKRCEDIVDKVQKWKHVDWGSRFFYYFDGSALFWTWLKFFSLLLRLGEKAYRGDTTSVCTPYSVSYSNRDYLMVRTF